MKKGVGEVKGVETVWGECGEMWRQYGVSVGVWKSVREDVRKCVGVWGK